MQNSCPATTPEMSAIDSVPSIRKGNDESHAIGLGQMNLHGYLARERIHYGSPEGIDFTNIYFATVLYHALRESNALARERGRSFAGFDQSKYADGSFFDKYVTRDWLPETERVAELFADAGIAVPTREEMQEIEISSRLYVENGARYMTATLMCQSDTPQPITTPVTRATISSGADILTAIQSA